MPRTFTGDERTAIAAGHYNAYGRLELMDSEGVWRDVSTDTDLGADFLNRVVLQTHVDQDCWTFEAELLLHTLGVSLAPLMEDSPANRDSVDAYAPFLDPSRRWRVFAAIVLHGATVVSGDWHPLCEGTYDIIEAGGDRSVIQLQGRDLGASLLDTYIDRPVIYGDNDDPIAMEDVLQKMLDDHLGPGEITLEVPTSPSFLCKRMEFSDISLMEMMNIVARAAAMVVRYRYDASDDFLLTLYAPNRDADAMDGEEDWILGPSEYLKIPQARLDLSGVRNKITLFYIDATSGQEAELSQEDTISVARFGGPHGIARRMVIDLADDPPQPMSDVQAAAFVQAMLSDVSFPPFLAQYEAPGFWIAQLGDWGKFTPNDIHYDTNQWGAVDFIRHTLANGNLRTMLGVGGQPKGRYRRWIKGAQTSFEGKELRIKNFREVGRDETNVTFAWTTAGVAEEFWLFLNTEAQPVPSDPWPSLTSVPFARFTPDTEEFDVAIPVDGSVTYGILLPIGPNATIGKPWQFTVQRVGAREIPQGSVAIDISGNARFQIDGAAWTASYKYTLSTSAFPTEADVIASGTVINGRQIDVTYGSPLSLGQTVYGTFVPFSENSAGGFQGTSMQLRATRFDVSASKTITFSASSFVDSTAGGPLTDLLNGYIRPIAAPANITDYIYATWQPTPGVTVIDVTANLYSVNSGTAPVVAAVGFYRVGSDGTLTELANTNSTDFGGWEAKSMTLSETTTGRGYRLRLKLISDTVAADVRGGSWSVTFTTPTVTATQ